MPNAAPSSASAARRTTPSAATGVIRGRNGHIMMTRVTGLGCTATALCGAFAAVTPDPAVGRRGGDGRHGDRRRDRLRPFGGAGNPPGPFSRRALQPLRRRDRRYLKIETGALRTETEVSAMKGCISSPTAVCAAANRSPMSSSRRSGEGPPASSSGKRMSPRGFLSRRRGGSRRSWRRFGCR